LLSELQKHLCAYGVLIDHKANFSLIGNRRNQALELRFASIVKREACVDRGIYFGSCFVEILLETIKGSLESGEDVLVSGFGKFGVKVKNELFNPGKPISIEAMGIHHITHEMVKDKPLFQQTVQVPG